MGKYSNLNVNVLNIAKMQEELGIDQIQQTANIIKASGLNRSRRKRLERSLGKMQKSREEAQKRLDKSSFNEYQRCVDKDYTHFFACLALTMIEDYRWKEDATHDQISSILERVNNKINKYAAQNKSTKDLIELVDSYTGIQLMGDYDE